MNPATPLYISDVTLRDGIEKTLKAGDTAALR